MTLKNQSILIVEDDGLIALHLQELLQNAGYDIPPPVASGEEAIEYVRTCPLPDLILMDVTLDGRIDGIETARQIQKSSQHSGHLSFGSFCDEPDLPKGMRSDPPGFLENRLSGPM